ncbi:GIY-YIG nuclease family protein [Citromicrobium bathyomarinum]|uniref:GIY-YIG nuclease family protein n=1 Tax=Citromicrobium bathyomarinum TaxID=72174 RepID=UPI00315A3696
MPQSALQLGLLFHGDSAGCKAFLGQGSQHYVYVLRRPDGRPFYVGKGIGQRVFQHENEARHPNNRLSNAHKLNVIRSIWRSGNAPTYEIDFVTDDPAAAYARETDLITHFGRLHEGGPLTNRAAGGGSTAGPAPISKERHSATLGGNPRDNPERAILNRFVLGIAEMGSVVIKPIGQFIAKPTVKFPKSTRSLSLRQAVAVAASAAANGILMDGACRIPRKLVIEDVAGLIENGVSCDLLTSGSVTLLTAPDPEDECFDLSAAQAGAVIDLIGLRKASDLGIITALG